MTKQTEAQQLALIMDAKGSRKRNELGDHWDDSWCNKAAAELRRLEAANTELMEALSFYADSTRYHGPNQSLNEPDKWSDHVGLRAYRLDVTRDGGVIASAAIAKHGGAA